MRKPEDIVIDVASRIRKIEDMLDIQRKQQRIIGHEVKCLHRCLEEGLKGVGMELKSDDAVLFSGGTPKEPPKEPEESPKEDSTTTQP